MKKQEREYKRLLDAVELATAEISKLTSDLRDCQGDIKESKQALLTLHDELTSCQESGEQLDVLYYFV